MINGRKVKYVKIKRNVKNLKQGLIMNGQEVEGVRMLDVEVHRQIENI